MIQLIFTALICLAPASLFTMEHKEPSELKWDNIESRKVEKWEDETDWVLDDIVNPTHWLAMPAYGSIDEDHTIRTCHVYLPENIDNENETIIWIVIHGTFASGNNKLIGSESPAYFDDSHPADQTYRHIKRFASWYATTVRKKLALLSFKWTGGWKISSRNAAANALKKFLDEFDSNKKADIVVLSHSHGCNVANYLSRLIKQDRAPIKLMIHFSCPKREETEYHPDHYEQIIYFFSDADRVIELARMNEEEVRDVFIKASAGGALATAGLIVALKIAAPPIGASAELIERADKYKKYIYGGYAVAMTGDAIYLGHELRALATGDNILPKVDDKITVGLRVRINGISDYGPIESHSYLVNIVKFLPLIIESLHTHYPAHYSMSSEFDLNVDLDNKPHEQNAIYIALRQAGGGVLPPDSFHYLGNDLDLRDLLVLSTAEFDNEMSQKETELLDAENERFKTKYGCLLNFGN